jgi:ribonuclease HI
VNITPINSDGAINVNENLAAIGTISREGMVFRGATGKTYRGILDPHIVESLALKDVVIYARGRGFCRVVFEVDSEVLVRLWHNKIYDRSVIKHVFDEISELSVFFTTFSLSYVRREANQTAHSCAKFASLQDGLFSWDAEPPAFLAHNIQVDCTRSGFVAASF